jgi:hypothetical protein
MNTAVYHPRLGILGGQPSIRSLLASIASVSKCVFHSFVDNPVEKGAQYYWKVKNYKSNYLFALIWCIIKPARANPDGPIGV